MPPLIETARPTQWLKNVLVFGAPLAAGVLDEPAQLGRTLVAFVAFCLASSGSYFWNDVVDVAADRRHPAKATRAVASGRLRVRTARLVGSGLVVVSLGVMALTGRWQPVGVLLGYVAVTLSYTLLWKHVAVLDLAAISSGFVLRAAGGAAAVGVDMSGWFVLVTTFGALFVATGKRFAEARELGAAAPAVRATLANYSEGLLRVVLTVASAGAIVSYCVWAFESRDLAGSELPLYELSIVPVVVAFVRYGFALERGDGAAPEDVFGRDRVLQALGAVWLVMFGAAVYA